MSESGEVFIDAVDRADHAMVNSLISLTAVRSADKCGYTALHYAARNGNYVLALQLIQAGANVNANQSGYTPLAETIYYMVYEGLALSNNEEVITLLIQKGANLDGIESLKESFTEEEHISNLKEIISFVYSAVETNMSQICNNDVIEDGDNLDTHSSNDSRKSDAAQTSSRNNSGDQKVEASLNSVTDASDTQDNNIVIAQAEDNSKSNALLDQLLSWIYELIEWIQEQTLNSAPIKSLIESTEQWNTIYETKNIKQDFVKKIMLQDIVTDSADIIENKMNKKASIANTISANSIDMNMTLNNPTIAGWILPTVVIESGNPFGDASFNGLNGIDILAQ